ncbi:MAG: UMP kinase [Puniceicoccales bacterium]|nr:UMP kinase [Puniceicoccales bacterium]
MGAIYKRVVLKISGELIHENSKNLAISHELLEALCKQIIAIYGLGVELSIVIGGGNIFRGHTYNGRNSGFMRTDADKMGMLATAINALALRSTLENHGIDTVIQSALAIEGIVDRFSIQDADQALKLKKIVIFCCGTGNPFFSTDSAAALRACELHADILLKATTVDGVYDDDPHKNPNAKKFDCLSYGKVFEKNLGVMDLTAFVLCMENNIPIRIFSGQKEGEMVKAVRGQSPGTFIGNRENGNR